MRGDCVETHEGFLKDKDGYPRMKWNKRVWRLNRLIWTLAHGPIADGFVVAHRCNNKGCINAAHFYLTTPLDNSSDARRDGLYRVGLNHPNAKATPEIVEQMRYQYHTLNRTQLAIGLTFGFAQPYVSALISGKARPPS